MLGKLADVFQVVNVLRDEELVVEHVFCLLDREQGGAEKLKEHGITLHRYVDYGYR